MLDGGPVGCVCLHGFTASPEEMRWLGEYLHERGITVYGPRLSGHGTTPARMAQQRWLDWFDDARDGVALLRARCRSVFVAGLSMGGLLSLRLAALGMVDGAVIMATPLYVERRLLPYARVIKYVRRYIQPKSSGLDARVRELQRQMGREDYGIAAYRERWPVAALAQLHALMRETRAHLPEITVPLLLIYSQADKAVPYDNMRQIADAARRADITQKTLEHSDHVLTQESERELVYALVWEWLAARTG